MSNACTWKWDKWHIFYETSCDQAFGFTYGMRELEFKYCPYCGKEIREVDEHDIKRERQLAQFDPLEDTEVKP